MSLPCQWQHSWAIEQGDKMICTLNGTLIYNDSECMVIECGGVGFKCYTTTTSSKSAGLIGSQVRVYTHLLVRDDAFDLYAFSNRGELEFFKLLIGVSGVGPKAAVSILSMLNIQQLALAIAAGDVKTITTANGIGKKSAERIVLDLKDKVSGISSSDDLSSIADTTSADDTSAVTETIEALVSLGYSRSDSARVVAKLNNGMSPDDMLRAALRELAKNL